MEIQNKWNTISPEDVMIMSLVGMLEEKGKSMARKYNDTGATNKENQETSTDDKNNDNKKN